MPPVDSGLRIPEAKVLTCEALAANSEGLGRSCLLLEKVVKNTASNWASASTIRVDSMAGL